MIGHQVAHKLVYSLSRSHAGTIPQLLTKGDTNSFSLPSPWPSPSSLMLTGRGKRKCVLPSPGKENGVEGEGLGMRAYARTPQVRRPAALLLTSTLLPSAPLLPPPVPLFACCCRDLLQLFRCR